MAGKWMDEGKQKNLDCFFKGDARPSWYLGLYVAPTSQPAEATTLSGLTEPTGGNYARIQLQDVDWTRTNNVIQAVQKTFACSGAAWGNVYGWFLTTVATGTAGLLLAAEHFSDGPYNVPDGGSVKVTAKVTQTSG
jgi:hypothetical protein